MADHEETYDGRRAEQLVASMRALAERIRELDRAGLLLSSVPELQEYLGRIRSELFHYEVRCTYDSPEVAESRRIVRESTRDVPFTLDEPDTDEPWRASGGD